MTSLFFSVKPVCLITILFLAALLAGCGAPPSNSNSNVNVNSNTNRNSNSTTSGKPLEGPVNTSEPEQYQATVSMRIETLGGSAPITSPALSAKVARSGADRRMEFTIPAGGHVIYLDKGDKHYLIMPDKKQYAEITKESTGFEIRRMMMPEQIVQQVKNTQGLEQVGETKVNGRDATSYRYASTTRTGTKAGDVQTQSMLTVDKQTGLPLHSETEVKAQAAVQGYNGVRVLTDITDIDPNAPADLFELPTGLQKIEAEQVREQVNAIFNVLASVVGELLKQPQGTSPAASPAATR